jgi:predicted nucleic acid-binding protein
MSPVKVVDASALAAIIFGENTADAVSERLEAGRLLAPRLIDYEMATICLTKLRRDTSQRDKILLSFTGRNRIIIERVKIDFENMLTLAVQSGLSAYDASYLWLARHHDAELVTLDKKLQAAFASPVGR